jgi:hypothetical protein
VVAESEKILLEPKKLTRNASVAIKVRPCLNGLVTVFSDMEPKPTSSIFPSYGPTDNILCKEKHRKTPEKECPA